MSTVRKPEPPGRPVMLTKRVAGVLLDLANDRLSTMVVVDREDARVHGSLIEAVRLLEGAAQ